MVSRKSLGKPPPSANLDVKPTNKLKRQSLHIKRKRLKDSTRRAERYRIKKEEAKNPKLREERLKRNIPLTIDRKRVWDEADSDVEVGLGLSVDVERIKKQKQKQEEEEEFNKLLDHSDESQDNSDDQDEVDSMLASSDDEEDEDDDGNVGSRKSSKSRLPSATERATSPTQSTKSTNLNLAPEALASKFPSLFPTEAFPAPKILITTSLVGSLICRCNIPCAVKHLDIL
jgi:ribosome production factor 1